MNRLQRYSSGIRTVNRIRQHEQLRPKYYSIYNFNESGKETGRVEPLHDIRYYKAKTREENSWQMRMLTIRSPKWSWITANHYERLNTYLQSKNILRRYRDFVITQRLETAARPNGISAKSLITNLKRAGLKLDVEMLEKLAIYEPNTFKALTELANRTVVDNRWDEIRDRFPGGLPKEAAAADLPEGKRVVFNTVTRSMKEANE